MEPHLLEVYFEAKARALLGHNPENKDVSFYVIDDPYDLSEFDMAVRNFSIFPAIMIDLNDGFLSDNNSTNYTNNLRWTFMILDKPRSNERIREVRHRCYQLGFQLLASIRKDQPKNIIPNKLTHMRINSGYEPIGPINRDFYGYRFDVEFYVNFNF